MDGEGHRGWLPCDGEVEKPEAEGLCCPCRECGLTTIPLAGLEIPPFYSCYPSVSGLMKIAPAHVPGITRLKWVIPNRLKKIPSQSFGPFTSSRGSLHYDVVPSFGHITVCCQKQGLRRAHLITALHHHIS